MNCQKTVAGTNTNGNGYKNKRASLKNSHLNLKNKNEIKKEREERGGQKDGKRKKVE